MATLKRNEWYLFDIAASLDLSYGRIRGIVKDLGIEPTRKIRNQPVFTTAQVKLIEARNTKPGPKGAKK